MRSDYFESKVASQYLIMLFLSEKVTDLAPALLIRSSSPVDSIFVGLSSAIELSSGTTKIELLGYNLGKSRLRDLEFCIFSFICCAANFSF